MPFPLPHNHYCCLLTSPAYLYMPHLFTHCLPTIIICVIYVAVYCVFFLFLPYATYHIFVTPFSILACLYTYFLFRFYFFVSIHAIATILYCHLPYGFSMQFMCLIWSLFLKFFMVLAWWNVFVYLWCCSLVSTTFYYFPFVPVCTTWLLCFLIQLLSTNMSLPWLLGHIQKYERVSLSFKQCWVWSVF